MKSPYETNYQPSEEEETQLKKAGRRRSGWIVLCLSLAAISVVYRLFIGMRVEQSAIMFIGLPTLLAIMLSHTPPGETVTGRIMKGITMMLLLAGILFIEGMICILMAAPLFYLVGGVIGFAVDASRRKTPNYKNGRLHSYVVGVMLMMSMEGITDWLSFDRDEEVVVSVVTELSQSEALARVSRLDEFNLDRLPRFLKLGFPKPETIRGSGTKVGDEWTIHFAGGEGKPGDLVMRVTSIGKDYLECRCISDGSHISHWLDWKTVRWDFSETTEGKTRVVMRLRYQRLLDPAWYFKPVECYGVRRAGEYLLQEQLDL